MIQAFPKTYWPLRGWPDRYWPFTPDTPPAPGEVRLVLAAAQLVVLDNGPLPWIVFEPRGGLIGLEGVPPVIELAPLEGPVVRLSRN